MCRWYEAAKKATGKARLDAMARHLVAGWLNTLERGRGTPCRPLIVRWRCSNEARCGGIGDRINGIQTAFWMVRLAAMFRQDASAAELVFSHGERVAIA